METTVDAMHAAEDQLRAFLTRSTYATEGGIVTDLDGTVVHEARGRIYLPDPVEFALKELYDLGRPLMINSLRFPLSVLRTFGADWYKISNAPIPTVSMNGSQIGMIHQLESGELSFEEVDAFPLTASEIEEVYQTVCRFIEGGVNNLLVFYYPRDWRRGELIWTPVPEQVLPVKEKYVSASGVTAVTLDKLREELLAEDMCMIFLLVDAPEDTLMAYQHTGRAHFYTRQGVHKLYGSLQLAKHLKFDLAHSVGAGDSEMDSFLSGVGLALVVGRPALSYRGLVDTIHLRDSLQLGEFLSRFAAIQRELL